MSRMQTDAWGAGGDPYVSLGAPRPPAGNGTGRGAVQAPQPAWPAPDWGPPAGNGEASPPRRRPVDGAPGPGGRRAAPAHRRAPERSPARARDSRSARSSRDARRARSAPRRRRAERRTGGLAVVYDIDGPRIRLGVGWFLVAVAALALPATTALVYGVVAGVAGRQIVRAWRSVSWQADLAAVLAALPVLVALAGLEAAVAALAMVVVVAVVAAMMPGGERFPSMGGRIAAAGIVASVALPATAGAALVLVRLESVTAAVLLVLLVSAYEAGDFVIGSGGSTRLAGPLAGAVSALVIGFPFAMVLLRPFDLVGVELLAFVAVLCPLGQILASAALPRAGAPASALRRIDSLLVLAPVWLVAATVAV